MTSIVSCFRTALITNSLNSLGNNMFIIEWMRLKNKISRPWSVRQFIFLLELRKLALNINLFLRIINDVLDSQSSDMGNQNRIQLIVFKVVYLLATILTFFSPEMILEIYPWFAFGSGGKYTLPLICSIRYTSFLLKDFSRIYWTLIFDLSISQN